MRKYIICLIFITAFIQNSCDFNDNVNPQLYIRLGTIYNTLRGVTLTWQSSETDDSIKWGYTTDYEFGEIVAERRNVYDKYLYDYTFPILKPQSQIHYSIKSANEWTLDKIYETSVDTLSESFSFIVGGDSQNKDNDSTNVRWNEISDIIANKGCDFVLHTGDIVQREYIWQQWETYFNEGKNLIENEIFLYSWGNHEYGTMALDNLSLPGNEKWYSFTQGNTLFISLLSEEDFDIQTNWLLDLLQNTDKKWIIVYFHKPFFTRGSHVHDMDSYRETWWKAFDDYGVDVVLNGHTHSYIRSFPLNLNIGDSTYVEEYGSKPNQGRLEIVTGGLGAKTSSISEDWFTKQAYSGLNYVKFNIDGEKLHFDAYNISNGLIDSLTIFSYGTPYVH